MIVGVVLFALTAFGYDRQNLLVPIVGFVASTTLLGFTVSKLSFTKLGINEVERVENKVKEKVDFIKEKQLIIDQLVSEVDDKELKKALSSLSEMIRFSDPMSNESVTGLESTINDKISNLSLNVKKFSSEIVLEECKAISLLIDQRNKKLKVNK